MDDLGYFLPLHFLFTKLPNVYYRPTILTKEKGGNYERTMRRRRGVRQNWLKRQRVYYIDRRTNKPSWLSFSHLIMIVLPLSSPFTLHFLTDFCCTVLCFCVCVCTYVCTHQEDISSIGRKGNLFYSYYLLHAIQTFDEKILSISVEQHELISSQFSYLILITFTHPSAFYLKGVTFITQWTYFILAFECTKLLKILKIIFCIY